MTPRDSGAPDTKAKDVETRRAAYDAYVAREIPAHQTMDHPLTLDPFDEDDVEGHMPRCHTCVNP
jgi:hypothetical protein